MYSKPIHKKYKNQSKKRAYILLELLFTLIIMSVILSSTLRVYYALRVNNQSQRETNLIKIELDTLRLFISKRFETDKSTAKFNLDDAKQILYYDGVILAKDIIVFNVSDDNSKWFSVDIELKIGASTVKDTLIIKK